MYPDDKRDGRHFNPIDVSILDILAMEADQEYKWKYPSKETLQTFEEFRGLGDLMLDTCTVKEINLNGDQLEQEQQDIIAWHHEEMAEDNDIFPYSPLSLDVEHVRCTLKDVLRLGGQQSYKKSSVTLSDRPGSHVHKKCQERAHFRPDLRPHSGGEDLDKLHAREEERRVRPGVRAGL